MAAKKILLVDSTNNFIRNYAVKPDLSPYGETVGGVVGFLQSLGYMVNKLDPDRVILIWDGPGGSVKRKNICKEYKKTKKTIRVNRVYDFQTDDTDKNMVKQRVMLAEYLKLLPLNQLVIPNVEADDVIAYLVHHFADDEKIIASNDKDFFQLTDDKTKVFRFSKKIIVDAKYVKEQYDIHPWNFALARAIVGDPSDELKGVPGIGFKRLVSWFPLITGDDKLTTEDLLSFCAVKKEKKYKRFVEQIEIVNRNYKLMQLDTPIISSAAIQKIKDGVDKEVSFNSTKLRMKLINEGIGSIGDSFFGACRFLWIKTNGN